MEHIITLPSDSSTNIYPDNKISNFTVDLDPSIELGKGDDWEVALLDINYPTRWQNVLHQNEMMISLYYRPYRHLCRWGLSPGSYLNARSFRQALHELNIQARRHRSHRHFKRMSMTKDGKFVLKTYTASSRGQAEILFTKSLANALGVFRFKSIDTSTSHRLEEKDEGSFVLLDNQVPKNIFNRLKPHRDLSYNAGVRNKFRRWISVPDKTGLGFQIKNNPKQCSDNIIFPHKIDPNANFRQFTVETNVIEADAFGRRDLRIFVPQTMTEKPEIVHKEFSTPQFKPLVKGLESLKTISIKILDELGRPVRFTGGKASVTLCLRRRQ